jgi:hypothetical protein
LNLPHFHRTGQLLELLVARVEGAGAELLELAKRQPGIAP